MLTTEIERLSEDGLSVQVWRFVFDDRDARLVLDSYGSATKATNRHKFAYKDIYNRTDKRNNTIGLDVVSFDDEIARAAYNKFIEKIKVVKAW